MQKTRALGYQPLRWWIELYSMKYIKKTLFRTAGSPGSDCLIAGAESDAIIRDR